MGDQGPLAAVLAAPEDPLRVSLKDASTTKCNNERKIVIDVGMPNHE
jgi:hypothetical protein